jgi:hypothetical protein
MLFPRRKKNEHRYTARFGVKIESCEIRSLLSATTPLVDSVRTVSAVEDVSNLPEEQGDPESRSVIEPVAEDVATSLTGGEVTEGSETTLVGSSDFDQWYSNNRDAILAAWSNVFSEVDLNSISDRPTALAELWNETLRSLYGGPLPYDSESGVESDAVVTEDTVVGEIVGDSVAEEVTTSLTNTVGLSYTTLRPVLFVYNETPADGSYGGVASELIEISSAVSDESNEVISRPVLEDRLTGNQYLLPAELTLVSERDLTGMLQYYGISEYRVDDEGRWVIPVSPAEGIGFLNRAVSLTYYDEIQSYLRSAEDTLTEVFSPTDFTVEVVLAAVDPATSRDLTLVLPDRQIGIYYETVTIGSDGSVTVVPPGVVEEQPLVDEPVVSEVVEAEVTEGSETTLVVSSDFDQWYAANRDAILGAWSNVFSEVDLNSISDRPTALAELWNETLRSLYGGPLPYDSVVTEDFLRVDETFADSVVDDVTGSQTETVNLGYMSLRPVVYVYNETPADGSYGGVALELIDISSVVSDEADEGISRPILEDRLTGTRYLLPAEVTLVSERDLTRMLASYGISEYRVEDGGRWVIPVSPDEGVGFLNRVWYLTYYDDIQSYLRSGGETQTEVFSATDFTVEVVLAEADPSTGRDLKLVLPDTRIGIYYETVTIGSDGSVTVVPPSVVEEQLPVEEPVVSEVVEAEVTEGSETTLVGSSDFDQWYSNNRDTILAIWSNAISALDLNDSTVDQTPALSQLWNETLRSLYGAELPWDGETVVENDVVVTEDAVLADETVANSVVEEVTALQTETVNLGYMSLRPVVYVYNETLADGGWGGVAFELIESSSVVYGESGELVSGAVLSDRLTGNQYLLPAEVTLVSERDLTRMLEYFGISEYRIDGEGRWVIPVSPEEGIGFLNRVWSLTYYDEIQSYLRSAGATSTEFFSSDDFSVEVVLRSVDPSAGRDLTLILPRTKIGINYETVTIGSDGSVTVVPPSVVEEQLPVEEPVVSEVVEAEVTEGSETTLVGSSDFDQWYSNNRDTILAIWSNAISALDLNDSTVDQTPALSQLWNETLRSLYGAELPWDGETVVENDVVVTEDAVLADETVADSVREEVTTSWTSEEFAEVSQTTVTDSRDFEQLYDGDAPVVSDERLIAVNDQIIEDAEQIDVEQIDVAGLSFRPVETSGQSLGMMGDADVAMDGISGFVSFSERPGESDLTDRSSGLSSEIDETSFLGSGDDQITISSSVPAGSLSVNWELEVLDEVFENLSFL